MTMPDKPETFDLSSHDIAEDKRQALLHLFPEVRTEGGKLDFERLKLALGEAVDEGRERYGMNWPGKAECFRTVQQPSQAALLPCEAESVNFDTSENLIIEGDNLEVLKLLQKSYLGKVKAIYLDPPYNTGSDFIYPDNFSESLQTYLEYTEQVDSEGRKFGTNPETDGRFHSKWLNMMYTRLFHARNLLREDGMIFVSIDDNELHNLRTLLNEVFGEENFIGIFAINASPSAIDYGHIAKQHDYTVFYAKNIDECSTRQLEEESKEFRYSDEVGPFNIYPLYNGNVAFNPKTRPNLYYPFFLNPNGLIGKDFYEISLESKNGWIEVYPVVSRKEGIPRVWRWGKTKAQQGLNEEIVGYKTDEGEYRIVQKSRHTSKVIRSLQMDNDVSSRRGTGDFEALFSSKLFSFPKPVELIKRFVEIGTENDSLVLDFFAGSGTTGQAVLELNQQDGGNRKFLLVQLPEPMDNKDFPTIADITKERVRRVIKKLNDEDAAKQPGLLDGPAAKQDRGFRVFKLAESNFTSWNAEVPHTVDALQKQLFDHIHHIRSGRSPQDILYELLLKSGFPLTTPVEALTLEGKTVYSVAGGAMFLCLERVLTMELIRAMAEQKPERVVCLDEGFAGNDQLKANAVQIFKTKGVTKFQTV